MAKSRDSVLITGNTPDEMKRDLSFKLQRLIDRMDKIEGIRGTSSIESDLDMNSNRVTDVADATANTDALNKAQADLTGNSPTFHAITTTAGAEIGTDLTVNGNVFVYDASGALIHSLE